MNREIITSVACDYCRAPAKLVSGDKLYPHRPDLAIKQFWNCPRCQAWVGCHADTHKPHGRLADAQLRVWKVRAHSLLDPIIRRRFERKALADPTYTFAMARGGRYKRLSELMGITPKETHIGLFSVEQCRRVVELCESGAIEK